CSPRITGDDHALPWMAVFQTTFFVSLHSVGNPRESVVPSPLGPRNCGQSAPAKTAGATRTVRISETTNGLASFMVPEIPTTPGNVQTGMDCRRNVLFAV